MSGILRDIFFGELESKEGSFWRFRINIIKKRNFCGTFECKKGKFFARFKIKNSKFFARFEIKKRQIFCTL